MKRKMLAISTVLLAAVLGGGARRRQMKIRMKERRLLSAVRREALLPNFTKA